MQVGPHAVHLGGGPVEGVHDVSRNDELGGDANDLVGHHVLRFEQSGRQRGRAGPNLVHQFRQRVLFRDQLLVLLGRPAPAQRVDPGGVVQDRLRCEAGQIGCRPGLLLSQFRDCLRELGLPAGRSLIILKVLDRQDSARGSQPGQGCSLPVDDHRRFPGAQSHFCMPVGLVCLAQRLFRCRLGPTRLGRFPAQPCDITG